MMPSFVVALSLVIPLFVLAASVACTPNIRDIVALLVGTGMRLDEALHLQWGDVELEHRQITIARGIHCRTGRRCGPRILRRFRLV